MSETNQVRRSLARGDVVGFVGAAASTILGFVLTVILSRMLGAEGAGIVIQAIGVFAIVVALTKVGFDPTVIYLMPRLSLDAPEEICAILSFTAPIAVGVSTVHTLILKAVAPPIWNAEVVASTRATL